MLTKNIMNMQGNIVQNQEETRASITNMERQLGQDSERLARLDNNWDSSELPIQKESNPKPYLACFEDEDTMLEIEEIPPFCVNGDVVEENTTNEEVLVERSGFLMAMVLGEAYDVEHCLTLVPQVCPSAKLDLIPPFPLFLPHYIQCPPLEESSPIFDPPPLVQATKEVEASGDDIFLSFSSFPFHFNFSTSHSFVFSPYSFHSFPNRPPSSYSMALTVVLALLFLFTTLVNSDFWAVAHDKLLRSLRCYLLNNTCARGFLPFPTPYTLRTM